MANHFADKKQPQDSKESVQEAVSVEEVEVSEEDVQTVSQLEEVDVVVDGPSSEQAAEPVVSPANQNTTNAAVSEAQTNQKAAKKQDLRSQISSIPSPDDHQGDSANGKFQEGFTSVFAPLKSSDAPSKASGKPTISFRNVSVVYPAKPDKPALQNVNLDIYPGEFVFLVGHSGSGKSSFIKLITRELKPTSGRVIVAGQDLTRMRNWKVPYLRRQLGCVFQDFKLLSNKTIYENVAFALECIGKPKKVIQAQVPEVLRLVGLGDRMNSYPDELSGGEQQRVSVARAMVNRPPLLVCDEPTGNLDPAISLGIMKLLERINQTGTTVLMATHDREMVDSMRKRVIALDGGHVVRDQEKGGYGNYAGF